MAKVQGRRKFFFVLLLCMATAGASRGQTFTSLVSFDGADGAQPYGGLVQGTDGNFYGTTRNGGSYGSGDVFKIAATGQLTTLYSFCPQGSCTDGAYPEAGLVQASDGNFYGTTTYGGPGGQGTIFEATPSGDLTVLYLFCALAGCPDGSNPYAELIQARDGNLYGTTSDGGTGNCESGGCGTVFKITLTGQMTTLYIFCSQTNSKGYCTDGNTPQAGLIQGSDGNFYGTTAYGGANGGGTAFQLTPVGQLTTLYNFCSKVKKGVCTDGLYPLKGLVQASNGSFYGTTFYGGAGPVDTTGNGTVFKLTPAGKLTTLHKFCAGDCTDGALPSATLIQATDGDFYGGTAAGGAEGPGGDAGTIFKITSSGKLTILHSLVDSEGEGVAGLAQGTDGSFYGTTIYAGANGDGSVFNLNMGLAPFVETRPVAGQIGTSVIILGTGLTGATRVTFHGKSASFAVVSDSEITATVPTGASSGPVTVITPGGKLTSNVHFQVEP